ncbi:MAG: hypothetical protein A2Y75_01595 [Candidatus Solincola sediminis]|uniref:Uncharacterized protein n=1 Tax=Candidatus Solincola sediminis TaxID=1797199 RepID=A0A1F2WNP0_9ACTN|nr:MAG: hypothetical protein A2Y75_01595 [Candidatus Solincola sediminis]
MLRSVGVGLASRGKTKAAERAEKVIGDMPNAFAERAKEEQRRFTQATDSEYWCCICFTTREEKEEFLKKTGLFEHGDKYLDGRVVAGVLGVELSSESARFSEPKISARMRKLSR